ncbi:unnamed protein product [Rotaria sp. Silwood2]|nr:unnamed protein product [Rotaria sp. Silwood2]CAF4374750.1 unnamed protein product [Rotaria sp. Silwood2]
MVGKVQTKLFKTVMKRATRMRDPYRQPPWPNNNSNTTTTTPKAAKAKKVQKNIQIITNKLYQLLIFLLDVNDDGRFVLPFSRRLILIDRPFENEKKNNINKNNTNGDNSSQSSEKYSSTDSEMCDGGSENDTSFDSFTLPPSPFVCDPYESYDWEC